MSVRYLSVRLGGLVGTGLAQMEPQPLSPGRGTRRVGNRAWPWMGTTQWWADQGVVGIFYLGQVWEATQRSEDSKPSFARSVWPRQTEQAAMNSLVSAAIEGHQKSRRMRVRWTPGWQANLDECPHCSTGALTDGGMNSRSGGHPSGAGWAWRASWTTSTSDLTAQVLGEDAPHPWIRRIVSGLTYSKFSYNLLSGTPLWCQ